MIWHGNFSSGFFFNIEVSVELTLIAKWHDIIPFSSIIPPRILFEFGIYLRQENYSNLKECARLLSQHFLGRIGDTVHIAGSALLLHLTRAWFLQKGLVKRLTRFEWKH